MAEAKPLDVCARRRRTSGAVRSESFTHGCGSALGWNSPGRHDNLGLIGRATAMTVFAQQADIRVRFVLSARRFSS